MKLRLNPNKTTVRITADEWLALQKSEKLNQKFWLSNTKTMSVSLQLAYTDNFVQTDEGFFVYIDKAGFQQQKTKKDLAWELVVDNNFSISVEVDVIKNSNADLDLDPDPRSRKEI